MLSKPAQKKICQRSREKKEIFPPAPETPDDYFKIDDKYVKTLDDTPFLVGQKTIESGVILMFCTAGEVFH